MTDNPVTQPMNMADKKFTFRDLKEEINKLTDEQLDKPVIVQREDGALRVSCLDLLDEDIYYHKEKPDDCASLEDLKALHGEEFNPEDYAPGPVKGTPFLHEDF